MNAYRATVRWERGEERFEPDRYHRDHAWMFDGGAEVPASASPAHVPPGTADPAAVDPEEAFVAALSSCHMLWFLSVAQRQGFVVDRYEDQARGLMARNAEGVTAITEVLLAPVVAFGGDPPSDDAFAEMHAAAHRRCFLAASVRSEVRCSPVIAR